jgi:hypothetical protein
MNNCIAFERHTAQHNPVESYHYKVGNVTAYCKEQNYCEINNDITAQVADGILLAPAKGDLIAYLSNGEACFVVQILKQTKKTADIHLSKPLSIQTPKLTMTASESLDLVALERFSLIGKQGVISVAASLVTCAEHLVQQVNQYMLNAKGLLRLSGRQQVITAEEDVRIDGKRINMG